MRRKWHVFSKQQRSSNFRKFNNIYISSNWDILTGDLEVNHFDRRLHFKWILIQCKVTIFYLVRTMHSYLTDFCEVWKQQPQYHQILAQSYAFHNYSKALSHPGFKIIFHILLFITLTTTHAILSHKYSGQSSFFPYFCINLKYFSVLWYTANKCMLITGLNSHFIIKKEIHT